MYFALNFLSFVLLSFAFVNVSVFARPAVDILDKRAVSKVQAAYFTNWSVLNLFLNL